jgi:hypothetical protein
MPKNKYTEKEAAKETDSSGKDTSRAWHQARENAQKDGQLPEREEHKGGETKDK